MSNIRATVLLAFSWLKEACSPFSVLLAFRHLWPLRVGTLIQRPYRLHQAGCYVPKHSILVGFEKGSKRRPVQVVPGWCWDWSFWLMQSLSEAICDCGSPFQAELNLFLTVKPRIPAGNGCRSVKAWEKEVGIISFPSLKLWCKESHRERGRAKTWPLQGQCRRI